MQIVGNFSRQYSAVLCAEESMTLYPKRKAIGSFTLQSHNE